MISAKAAFSAIMSRSMATTIEEIELSQSLGRTLACDIHADLDQPPFHRVAMDGIAIRSSELPGINSFKILQTIPAGSEVPTLPKGAVCFEIMTGSVLPPGADMVIRYEDLKIEEDMVKVLVSSDRLQGNFHEKGSDYRKGDKVLTGGTTIKSSTMAILASLGQARVKVKSLPKISIVSTGDELVDIHETPLPSQIRWSNGISLQQELKAFGFTEVTIIKVRDEENSMREVIKRELSSCDILLLTGGVSAGKYDYVPKLLKECEVQEVFHKVLQRPGKPLWFGETKSNKLVFGLPGNPVSCLVNLRKYIIPFLLKVLKEEESRPRAILSSEVNFQKNLTYYCLVKVKNEEGKLMAHPLSGNGSGDFFQMRDSDGFMELRQEEAPFSKGHVSEVFLWGHQ